MPNVDDSGRDSFGRRVGTGMAAEVFEQLKPELLIAAGQASGQKVTVRMQPGYDHSYFFMASFIADHIAFHAERLKT